MSAYSKYIEYLVEAKITFTVEQDDIYLFVTEKNPHSTTESKFDIYTSFVNDGEYHSKRFIFNADNISIDDIEGFEILPFNVIESKEDKYV